MIHCPRRDCEPDNWCLFIDSSKSSLMAVLLNNDNKLASVPLAYSSSLKEYYENLQMVLEKIKYNENKWYVCCDQKVGCDLFGQQGGYSKFVCFLCEWDSRTRENHPRVTHWPKRKSLVLATKHVIKLTLIDALRVVKAFNRTGPCNRYLMQKFPLLPEAKVNEGVSDGPQIQQLIRDSTFTNSMNGLELQAWELFKEMIIKFLGNFKDRQ
jgi:hypothetical protein